MTEILVKAAYATVAEEDGHKFIGFVDADEEGYVMFRQAVGGGPVWLEVNDEDFGADDAVAALALNTLGLEITLHPAQASRFGYASRIAVRLKHCEDAQAALAALRQMHGLPPLAEVTDGA